MSKGRGGYGGMGMGMGMPGNMKNLMKQAQRMQQKMQEAQKSLAEAEFTATSGGNAVSVTVSGTKELKAVKISPEALDPDDVEMLEDMIVAAVNEAMKKVDEEHEKLTGGVGAELPF